MSPSLPPVLIMGATASGKTGLSLALAERYDCEIISVDSAQVYRGMDIGSAKPDLETRARVPHHLIDILDPLQAYSAARFARDALRLIAEIRARGRMPLLVGGTMLYFRALTRGLSDLPTADPAMRAQLEAEALGVGWPAMHARLRELDPDTAARLHPNDQQRVQRALEVVALSGRTMGEHFATRSEVLAPPYLSVLLESPDRARLHQRIEQRFGQMMDAGFLDEVRRLRDRGDLHLELPSLRAVGYRQLWLHLEGQSTYSEAVAQGIAATRQFAKRQLTWLRNETADRYDPDDPRLLDKVLHQMLACRC
ncbi:MAG: tRNA dimethylallyltransferase [Hydrocarboniphaga sp.]|uniref:tRNA (adenosine(37)-N6)-dimethylallyltransferase MiaA n=1 Tax=Hydrocarboniphaga sp. TaxID=2033016 RepID=UPI00261457B4|nr:tRNA (adenosine(37)-N6)-dimethylallyltransferase MiaA [Hydrocarboniphaga sp.]MDB5968917.1 tRNA dimethylallyltransferase [Hydrocarboniphaga sp.]